MCTDLYRFPGLWGFPREHSALTNQKVDSQVFRFALSQVPPMLSRSRILRFLEIIPDLGMSETRFSLILSGTYLGNITLIWHSIGLIEIILDMSETIWNHLGLIYD